jgi:putative sugar O-methyltransferase
MTSLRELRAAYERSAAYVEQLRAERAMDGSDDVSPFWQEVLGEAKRRSHPTFSEMLVMRRGFTYPLGDRAKAGDGEADQEYARAAYAVVSRSMDPAELATFDESALGAPPVEPFGADQALSGGGVVNALTLHRIERALATFGPHRPLRVLEIGAGYGAVADQLMRRVDVASYTICDLPENLFLSGYYVPANHPQRSVAFLRPVAPQGAELSFVAPPYLDVAEGPFDLIVNSYSFQEMNRSSVDRYLRFAAQRLAADGLLFSLNAHGKAGISAPGEYLVDGLELLSVAPFRRFPWQVFGTNPYELLLRPSVLERDAGQARRLDRIGFLMGVGLHDELAPLCAAATTPEAADEPACIAPFEAALGAFATGGGDAAELAGAADGLGNGHARVLLALAAAALAAERLDVAALAEREAAAVALAPHLEAEIAALSRDPEALRALLASRLDLQSAPPRPVWQRRISAAQRHARLALASRTRR